jgi:hypothetical protein
MKQITLTFLTLISFVTVAYAHNGVEHGTEHITFFHIAHFVLLFGGIAAAFVAVYRERKELFKK